MKKVESVSLIVFIILAMSIYFYMGSMVASEEYPFKPMIHMEAKEAYAIWDLVTQLEEFWQLKNRKIVKDKKIYNVKDAIDNPIDEKKLAQLRAVVASYEYLPPLVEGLIAARREADIKAFTEQKEKIMQELAPIFADAIYQQRKKDEPAKSSQGWLVWIKDNITRTANRFYNYFFPIAQKK